MNKKFLSAILFGALMVTSTGTFVSCKDYDDDIDAINSELVDIKSQLSSLQSQVNSGKYVTNVTKKGEGIVVTWNDGTTSTIETIKGDKGETGATGAVGAKGEATVITIDPVTKNWVVDGVDTGICSQGKDGLNGKDGQDGKDGVDGKDGQDGKDGVDGKDGQDGKDGVDGKDGKDGKDAPIPTFTVGEDGHIYVQYGEEGEKLDLGTSTGGIYVVENGLTVTLHVCDAEGNWNDVVLPTTKVITALEAVTIDKDGQIKNAEVTLYYGAKLAKDVEFNGQTYTKNSYLISQNATLSAIVNPFDADATKYDFALIDTKGNAPFIVSDVKQNVSEKALSRAATANQGVWDMTLAFASSTAVDKSGTYALTTESANGTVASPYDVKVACKAAPTTITNVFKTVEGNYNTEIDLTKAFDGEWKQYIVDYYFEIADETAAAAAGISIVNGDKVVCTTNKTATYYNVVKVKALLVNNTQIDRTVAVKVNYVAPTTQLSNVEWTINKDNKVAYVSLSAIQAQLAGATDVQLPSYAATDKYTWADGEELDKKSVVVNDVYYGADVTGKTPTKFATLNKTQLITSLGTELYVKNDQGQYVPATIGTTKIQDELFMQFNFNERTAFPGEYVVYVGFKKFGTSVNALEAPVYVTINAPTQTIVKYENYFIGNDAVAYGNADYNYATYDLNNLFKTTGLKFTETAVKKTATTYYTKWLQADGHNVKVPAYRYGTSVDNTVSVGSAHEYTASIIPFNNNYIQKTEYKFNLTIKSAINEGEFSSVASKTIETSEPVEFLVSDFTAVDVFGDNFYIAKTYKKSGDNWVDDESQDDRIHNIIIEPGDDNATNYLSIDTQFSGSTPNAKGSQTFKVERKQGLTQLVADTECKVKVTVEDKWGVKTSATVTVVLKKFGN